MPAAETVCAGKHVHEIFDPEADETRIGSPAPPRASNVQDMDTGGREDEDNRRRRHSFSIEEFRAKFVKIFLMFENRPSEREPSAMAACPEEGAASVTCQAEPRAGKDSENQHQPIIRDSGRRDEGGAGEKGQRAARKNPLLRVLSSHSGLADMLHVRKSDVTREAGESQQYLAPMTYSAQRHVRKERLSRLSSQPVLSQTGRTARETVRRLPAVASDTCLEARAEQAHSDSSAPSSPRVVSTASIRLREEGSRERSASEERRISVIRTAASLPDMTRPSPMLDAWLTSLVRQSKNSRVEEMGGGEEPLLDRQLYSRSSVWPSADPTCHAGLPQRRPCTECVQTFSPSSSHKHCSSCGRSLVLDQGTAMSGPDPGISIHVTDDEDSACVQSVSDSASVQLCVPCQDDLPPCSPRQHLPLSPCSSVGSTASFHSARSSNADSAVDLAAPDDDTLEIEFYTPGQSPTHHLHHAPAVHLRQAVFARSKLSSSSSSSCQTVVETPERLHTTTPTPSTTTTTTHFWPMNHNLPSFVISDHSDQHRDGVASPDSVAMVTSGSSDVTSADSVAMVTSGSSASLDVSPCSSFSRTSSTTSMSSLSSFCSSTWSDSSTSDVEASAGDQPRRKKVRQIWLCLHRHLTNTLLSR